MPDISVGCSQRWTGTLQRSQGAMAAVLIAMSDGGYRAHSRGQKARRRHGGIGWEVSPLQFHALGNYGDDLGASSPTWNQRPSNGPSSIAPCTLAVNCCFFHVSFF